MMTLGWVGDGKDATPYLYLLETHGRYLWT